jgi:hypothetical protein
MTEKTLLVENPFSFEQNAKKVHKQTKIKVRPKTRDPLLGGKARRSRWDPPGTTWASLPE